MEKFFCIKIKRNVSKLMAIVMILAAFAGMLWSPVKVSADSVSGGIVTVNPQEIDSVLHNPDMGWVLIDNALPGHIDCGRTGTYPEFKNVAVLSCWSELEPSEGNYDWSLVDQAINYWSGLGKRIHLRISTDAMIISAYKYVGGVPEWVFTNYSVPYQIRTDQNLSFKLPDYTNSIFKQKLQNFMTAFANKYKNNQYIDIVDLRGYGTWGEWHSGHDFASYTERKDTLKGIIDQWYNAWSEQKILALSNTYEWRTEMQPSVVNPTTYNDYLQWSAFDYALTKPKITFRRDGIAGAVQKWDSKLLHDFFNTNRNLPIICEYFTAYDRYNQPGGYAGYTVDSALNEALMYHPNYMTNMGFDGDNNALQFYNGRPDIVEKGNKLMGYRFVLTKASYPQIVEPGESFTLNQEWINRAVGRCFKKYPLKVFLTDSNGNVIWSGVDNSFDQTSFVSGEIYDVASHFMLPSNIAAGTYDLKIAMVDSSGNPKIKLAIANGDSSNRYKIGTLTVGSDMEGFEGGSFASSRYTAGWNNSYGNITAASTKVISGTYSANGSTAASTDWFEFLYSDVTKIKLQGGATYNVTFKYKTLAAPGANGYHYFFARTASGGSSRDKGFTQWNEAASSTTKTKTISLSLDDFDDYYLVWGLHYGGEMSVDEITITKVSGSNGEGFTTSSFSSSNYTAGNNNSGIITNSADKVINGTYSVYGSTASTTDWYEFLYSDKNKILLQGGSTYKVTFKYKASQQPGESGHYYFLARTATGGFSHDKGTIQWRDDNGKTGTKTAIFTLDSYNDYYLLWGLHYGGGLSIDDIKITKLSNAQYESFESGSFTSTRYVGGYQGAGVVTSTSGSVLNGAYSVYSNSTTAEWQEYLYTDTSKMLLKPNMKYTVSFRYKPCRDVGNGGFYYFLARTGSGGVSNDKGYTQWMDKTGTEAVIKTLTFKTGNYNDYYLVWGINNTGAAAIDEVILIEE